MQQDQYPILKLPEWLLQYANTWSMLTTTQDKMAFVIEAAKQNVQHESGGPFAAAVFNKRSAALLSLGVNLVTSHNNCILHAEVVAIMLAQQKLATYNLSKQECELVSSSEPCAMCAGAFNWSGISQLAYGASIEDAEALGFDEGPVSPSWQSQLRHRGASITGEVLRDNARNVLQMYKDKGGLIYNGGNLN